MWLNNINCPEFKTGGELFQIKVLEFLMIFQNIWSCFISFLESLIHISGSNKLNEFNSDNSLFMELLPLLAGFDIAVLAFALPSLGEVFNRLLQDVSRYQSKNELLDTELEKDYQTITIWLLSHFFLTLLLIFLSVTKFIHENKTILFLGTLVLMLWTGFLIFGLTQRIGKLIFKDTRKLDLDRVIESLGELMIIHKNFDKNKINNAVKDLSGIVRNQQISSMQQEKIFEIFYERLNEYLDTWRACIIENETWGDHQRFWRLAVDSHTKLLTSYYAYPYDDNDLFFNNIKDALNSLIELYKNSNDNIKKNIFLLGYRLLQYQMIKPDNIEVINVLQSRFHRKIIAYESNQIPINENNLDRSCLQVFLPLACGVSDDIPDSFKNPYLFTESSLDGH